MNAKTKRGRRTAAEEMGALDQLRANPLPPLGDSPRSILAFIADVTRRVGAGELDRPTAEVLAKLARTGLTAERTDHERTEVTRLIKAVEEMKVENDRAEERQRAIQQGRDIGPRRTS